MTAEVALIIAGSVFLAIATIGGGIEVQQIRIPGVPAVGRAVLFVIAVLFLVAATSLIVTEARDPAVVAEGPSAAPPAPTASVLAAQETRPPSSSAQPTPVSAAADAVVPAPPPSPTTPAPALTPVPPPQAAPPVAAPPAVPAALGGGLFCKDLRAAGHSYAQAVDYWYAEGAPDRMDADLNGIPCETVYPAADVQARWSPP